MSLRIEPVRGVPEIGPGDDVAGLVLDHLADPLRDGDVVVVTSKVVAKAAGLARPVGRTALLDEHTDRVVAARGPLRIVRTHHGLVLAAAGVDESNTPAGTSVPLPADPDDDARRLRSAFTERTGARVAVVVTDTAGRAWRDGQTDLAIGVAGMLPLVDLAGQTDASGRELSVTAPAVADEVAAAADLVAGKAAGVPAVVVRGLDPAWLTEGDGPGARALVRPEETDLFGLGAVDAVRAALRRQEVDARGFPTAPADALADVVAAVAPEAEVDGTRVVVRPRDGGPDALIDAGARAERVRVLAAAHRLHPEVVVLTGSGR